MTWMHTAIEGKKAGELVPCYAREKCTLDGKDYTDGELAEYYRDLAERYERELDAFSTFSKDKSVEAAANLLEEDEEDNDSDYVESKVDWSNFEPTDENIQDLSDADLERLPYFYPYTDHSTEELKKKAEVEKELRKTQGYVNPFNRSERELPPF